MNRRITRIGAGLGELFGPPKELIAEEDEKNIGIPKVMTRQLKDKQPMKACTIIALHHYLEISNIKHIIYT